MFFLWHDPWLINKPLIEQFGESIISIAESSNLATVSSIITDGLWTPSSSNDVLLMELRDLLNRCRIHSHDETTWAGTKPVNLATIWNSIRRSGTPPP